MKDKSGRWQGVGLFWLLVVFSAVGCGGSGASTGDKMDGTSEVPGLSDAEEAGSEDGAVRPGDAADSASGADSGEIGETTVGPDGPEEDQAVKPARKSAYECLLDSYCDQILIAAHRGDHVNYPECSLAAVRGAAALGVDFVELDTRTTADGVVVLMHDSTVDRTTDGTGDVGSLTWDQIQALTLKGSDPANPETQKVPTFDQALALAADLGLMVYVDQKTSDWQKVVEVIRQGGYEKVALIRDDLGVILAMAPTCGDLLLMPATETVEQVQQALQAIPNLRIVELSYAEPKPDFVAGVHQLGVKVQQDVMATGDTFAVLGKTAGWKGFLDAGVNLWQSDMPGPLVQVVRQYEETGVFPETL